MMSEQEKQYIVKQRALGKSFAQIGRELGRGESSVRYAFNHSMDTELKIDEAVPLAVLDAGTPITPKCKYCGRDFAKPALGGKRLFCSDHCRNAWCNEQKRSTPYSRVCEQCGCEFTAFGNPHKRFCSRKCFADSRKAAQADKYMEVRV
ncbi:MAG: hypothetical protein NC548_48895 [Lachnospiraceae bacterium]|nr:hypothetical protein [Lachnospiraceae bacterium]